MEPRSKDAGPPSSALRRPARGLGHNLPSETTSFVGRDSEIEALLRTSSEARVVTIVGAPGTGKTRLALRAAERRLADYLSQGGVWFIELARAKTLDDVCASLATALGALAQDAGDPVARLGHVLGSRGATLIVLDNFEQIVDLASKAISEWVDRAPKCRFLITSRERLRIPEERMFELGPLDEPSALRLWVERAPGFQLDDDNAPAVGELLRELDGLPLAIELAAARLDTLGFPELQKRMRARLDLLAHGPRTADARQATLRGALDGSWDLLTAPERRAFATSSLFAGGFELGALEHVLGHPTLDVYQALREKSLLVPIAGEPGRSRLYASVRAYASEKLAELPDRDALADRAAAWFAERGLAHAEQFDLEASAEAWSFLSLEIENLAASFNRAVAQRESAKLAAELLLGALPVSTRRGPPASLLQSLSRVIAHVGFPEVPAALRARVFRARAAYFRDRGEAKASLDDLDRALGAADESGQAALAAEVFADMAFVEQSQGRFDRAHEHADHALARLDGRDEPRAEGRVLAQRGLLLHAQGKLDDAYNVYDRALTAARRARDPWTEAGVRKDIGSLRLQQGRLDEAREHYAAALEFETALGSPTFGGLIAGNLGILEQERGDFDEARACLADALATFRQTGSRLYEGHVLGYLAGLELEHGTREEAARRYGEAIDVLREVGDKRLEGLFWAGRGAAEALRDRVDAAREAFVHAQERLDEVADPGLKRALEIHRALLLLAEARAADSAEVSTTLREHAAAVARDARVDPLVEKTDDARFALRILERALSAAAIVWNDDDGEIGLPNGECVSLAARAPLRRMVAALVENRVAKTGAPVNLDALLEAGWPGEKMSAQAGANRVKVALSTLRKLGLRDLIMHAEGGWVLDPSLPVFRK